jgi:hypothetical protein
MVRLKKKRKKLYAVKGKEGEAWWCSDLNTQLQFIQQNTNPKSASHLFIFVDIIHGT